MGIKHLWSILEPFCERKPLHELHGKIVAIDLAGWICEALCVVDYSVQPKFYLRNLFFRTCYLLLSGCTPVYVLDGKAPELKSQTISKRNEIQFKGARPRTQKTATQDLCSQQPIGEGVVGNKKRIQQKKGRSQFNFVLKQCEQLLAFMGIKCVQAPGEAEAYCAYLNEKQLVDGVISQDSDCFAYGAIRVYRNFSVSTQGKNAAQGGSVDVYDIQQLAERKSFDFGRNKMIVMALLCGCDYCPEGVGGIGKDSVLKLFDIYKEEEILKIILKWPMEKDKLSHEEIKVNDKNVCINCGHLGKLLIHKKNGCSQCCQSQGCDENLWKNKRQAIKCQLQIRKKAMEVPNFPSQEIIDEFQQCNLIENKNSLKNLCLDWNQPNIIEFLKFMVKHLQWIEIYCFQKMLPLLTRWQLFQNGNHQKTGTSPFNLIQPILIKKTKTPKGIPSYEIIWEDNNKIFNNLIPTDQLNEFLDETPLNSLETLWTTIEPIDLVECAYPKLVSNYLQQKEMNKKAKKPTKSTKQPIKRKSKTTKIPLEKLINFDFISTKINSPKIKTSSTPIMLNISDDNNVNADDDDFDDDIFAKELNNIDNTPIGSSSQSSIDMLKIITGIITKTPELNYICGKKLRYDKISNQNQFQSSPTIITTPTTTPINYNNSKNINKRLSYDDDDEDNNKNKRVSNFFTSFSYDDVFEKSIDFKNMNDEEFIYNYNNENAANTANNATAAIDLPLNDSFDDLCNNYISKRPV